ncbi:MAG: N,N-dimethylformamidase beta subunit family domain-containing protein [Pirellulaceae bacterium]
MRAITRILTMLGLFTANVTAGNETVLPRAMPLEGLHAYAEKIVSAGDTIHFRVTSTVPYELSICRLGHAVDDPARDDVLFTFPESPPVQQPIHPGSFVHVSEGLPDDVPLAALTLECWGRPWRLNGWQSLLGQHNYPTACGYSLGLDVEGRVQFYLSDGGIYRPERTLRGPVLAHRQWQHVVGTWDGATKSLWVDGKLAAQEIFGGPVQAGTAPLWLGACGHDGPAVNILDGDLAMPVLYDRALSADEIRARYRDQGLTPATGQGVLACWPLTEERGERVADCSAHGRHGQIINSANWMIGGPSFDGSQVPRFSDYEPTQDPQRGHGLRFASDDLYDCRWQVNHEYTIPKTAKPGLYVGRFRFTLDGQPRLYHATFVVKREATAPKAPLLVIAATSTWLAYRATPFAVEPPTRHCFWDCAGIPNSAGEPPAYCMYRDHQAGQPAYKIGVHTPWPNAGPYVLYSAESVGYSHLMRAERFALIWLEQNGYEYDMVGDWDVHRNPDLLEGYPVVLINGHSEYWSGEAFEAVDRYLCKGGNVMVLSGNSICWRVSYDEEGTIMECRKLNAFAGGRPGCTVGEIWHSQDGRRGSLARECGYPAWKLVGLDSLGFWGAESNVPYEVTAPEHLLFQHPEPVGLAAGSTFGTAPDGGHPKAVGHEPDVRLSLLRELTVEIPPGATLPEEPAGIITLAEGKQPHAAAFDYFFQPVRLVDGVACHMIYWERPQGGRVFHAGSLGAGWGLSVDPKFQTLLRNVLFHFGIEAAKGGGQQQGAE